MNFRVGDRVKWEKVLTTEKGFVISLSSDIDAIYPIHVKFEDDRILYFTSDGRFTVRGPVELVKFDLNKKIQKILKI